MVSVAPPDASVPLLTPLFHVEALVVAVSVPRFVAPLIDAPFARVVPLIVPPEMVTDPAPLPIMRV